MAWYAAVAASNAANYGARVGSVAQTNPTEQATAAAQTRLDSINIGTYAINATGDDTDGSKITVSVDWTVPNYITGLMTLLGSSNRNSFAGTVISTFPQDGL